MALTPTVLKRKHRIVPGAVTVTYYVANAGGGTSVDGARKRTLKEWERQVFAFRLGQEDCFWFLATENLGTIVPAPGDSLTDSSGTLWLIESVESSLIGSDYKCYAVKGR
jgi:hypothetical protein